MDGFTGERNRKHCDRRPEIQASALGKPTLLSALQESPVNVFYLSQGFVFECEEGVDRHYFFELEEH